MLRSLTASCVAATCAVWILVVGAILNGADRPSKHGAAAPKTSRPSPIEDDSNLHDVQFVGSRTGWAVGDHGVIWHSQDGGENWVLQPSGVECPLHSICFLSDRVGWIAGGGTVPFTRQSYGIILHTTDGGQTWLPQVGPPSTTGKPTTDREKQSDQAPAAGLKPTEQASLPRLRWIKFFSLDSGIAVGEGAGPEPSGAYVTRDGGRTWQTMPGKASPGWLAADFLGPDAGVLVGVGDSRALAVEGKIVTPRFERLGTRGLYGVALGQDRTGWLVGDGGLVLRTENAGLVWQAPPSPLATGVRDAFDFRTVCFRGEKVWLTGSPGSIVWHSPDAGQTWQRQRTPQSIPLARLYFATDERGWGVGALGTILRTVNGGRTWTAIRGADRRLALLALYGRNRQASLGLVTELAGEDGYRTLVSVLTRDGDDEGRATDAEIGARFDEAVTRAGGSAGQVGWQLPLAIPGLDRDLDRLVADWNRRTENRLDEILTGTLVRQLRTWRPSVLIIEQPETGSALAKLIAGIAAKAVAQAADSTRFFEHQELAGLESWQVQKTFVRLPDGSAGHVTSDPFRYLPHLGSPANIVSSSAESLFLSERDVTPRREAYRLVRLQSEDVQGATVAGGLFAGISIPAGGTARRATTTFDDSNLEARLKGVQKQRNFAAYSERFLNDSRHAGQLIGQLSEISRGLPDAEAAWQLLHLADQYQASGHWELGELALVELIEKFPGQPAARRGMQRLVQAWGSTEVTWRRLKQSSTEQRRDSTQPDAIAQANLEYVESRLRKQSAAASRTIFNSDDDDPDDLLDLDPGPPTTNGKTSQKQVTRRDLEQKQRYWRARALKMFVELSRRDAALAAEPVVQFPLATIHRQRTSMLKSDEIYRRYVLHETGTPWARAAESELWLTNISRPPTTAMTACRFAPSRPVLDGNLSDPCWQEAVAVALVNPARDPDAGGKQSSIRFCYDAAYLYVSAQLPRAAGARQDGPIEGGRRYDDDLDDFDRVVISLDIDRDYVTSFNFTVDQRGCTRDACWQDTTWNPRWFVAVAGNESEWRLEVAIPLEEITPYVPRGGNAWAIGITRIIPALGVESWTQPASAVTRPETFGLLRFDAPGAIR